jgi:ribonuclease HI
MESLAKSNDEKGHALAKSFFSSKLHPEPPSANTAYPPQCSKAGQITKESILRQLCKLKPYKAPGPDGILNIVLMKCADLLIDRLHYIYSAIYNGWLYYDPWKAFNTIMLYKPGKPSYKVPKAYRLIALINTLWKVLTAILAKQLTYFVEKYQLLLSNHFGGRLGCTTTDVMHLLTYRIKSAWHKKQVVAVLFLDIEGAFPNMVPPKLIHNLKMRKVPKKLINFAVGMLEGHVTTLKFNDYTSMPIPIDNSIGQGDPLSMVLYQFYNADLLDIPNAKNETAIAYMDDTLLIATVNTFEVAHQTLASMMTRINDVIDWSNLHNSPLEYSKLALIDFAHQNSNKLHPHLHLPHIMLSSTASTKYLGVHFDQNLKWNIQLVNMAEKGTKWLAQIKRAACPSWGITPKYARRLYISIALPKVLYAVDIWCTPMHGAMAGPRVKGSAAAVKTLTSVQRAGAIAITGGLRTSPTDTLNACAYTIPAAQLLEKWCFKAAVWLSTLPSEHPLYKLVKSSAKRSVTRHKSPLHNLMQIFKLDPNSISKIATAVCNPLDANKIPLQISIASSKEESKIEASNALESIKIYLDRSENNGKVGAAAVLLNPGHWPCTLHYHLGSDAEHTIQEAELIGILLGIHLIKTEKKGRTSFALGTDNQATIKTLTIDLANPGQKIALNFLKLAESTRKSKGSARYLLMLRWTAGHLGIAGNERADKEAKAAAAGITSDKNLLPSFL